MDPGCSAPPVTSLALFEAVGRLTLGVRHVVLPPQVLGLTKGFDGIKDGVQDPLWPLWPSGVDEDFDF